MFGKNKAPAKAEPKKAPRPRQKRVKGPDNNKRLAELEAKEAERLKAERAKPPKASLSQDYPLAFDMGRRARGASISREQPPFGPGNERDAWLEGYDS